MNEHYLRAIAAMKRLSAKMPGRVVEVLRAVAAIARALRRGPSPQNADLPPYAGLRSRVIAGLAFMGLLLVGLGGWAATAKLNGAVIASGTVKVDQNLKVIQHRDGGIIARIMVREGDPVEAGQVMMVLDDLQLRAEQSILRTQLNEALARVARLKAESAGADRIDFGPLASDTAAQVVIQGEERMFAGRQANLQSQEEQIRLAMDQIGQEVEGLQVQRTAFEDELVLVEAQHADLKNLLEKKLVEQSKVQASERELVQFRGRIGEIDTSIARSKMRVGELEVKRIALADQVQTEAQGELSLTEARVAELTDRLSAVEGQLARTRIRAPIAGLVNELRVHTEGGVISPAEVLATIVPSDATLKIEVRLAPSSVDQIWPGQEARLRFTAFNSRTTPELSGAIAQVSPATTVDANTGEAFYVASVSLSDSELAKLGDVTLLPGMPVEAYMTTREQTALAYLMRPVTDQFARAMREE